MYNRLTLISLAMISLYCSSIAQPLNQKKGFTHQDSLRGSINAERDWWDVDTYTIDVTPDYLNKSIIGVTSIGFSVIKPGQIMQIDLQEPMQIDKIEWKNKSLAFTREGNAWHVRFPDQQKMKEKGTIKIFYSGKPRVAVRPPWDGGWIFQKDKEGRPWMSVACQGLGASVWYPCKDHQSDEPDHGATINVTVPDTLVVVANGKLLGKKESGELVTYSWGVVNPINNYNIVPYIGKYVNWSEDYAGEKGNLKCDYWVLDYELEKAKVQFRQVPKMLKSFEYWFGPYPFYEDGYKLVQSPHLGMEHQSAVAYGNEFKNGYRGRDLSGTGWGTKWDFIIIHESGHEWFANNITTKDIADMWVHEGFTNYSETLFTTSEFGVEAGNDYVIGTRKLIQNDMPIIGHYGVNQEGSGDMYYKGGNLLHTIRAIINNDEKFRQILRGLNKDFYHQTVTSAQVEQYISTNAGY
ncbi:MAG: M1 family metallopeptidase, partial [Chitinophagaceae bacterium]|nr:M1 family metallopeptidase [Chitinophagaceae bacterium]